VTAGSAGPPTPAPSRTWTLAEHAEPVSVVRLPVGTALPDWADGEPLISVTWTRDETSVVCPSRSIPDALPGSVIGPYVAFQVAGPVDHALTGVLAALLAPLAEAEIPILTVATYDTDWILVPAQHSAAAAACWTGAGHAVVRA
jgi:hypothetical protein